MLLTPAGEWKPSDLYDEGQWEDSDDGMSSGANVSATSYTKSNDVLETILSAPQYKSTRVTFADDVDFTKGATENILFFGITELDTREFDNYGGFSTSTAVGPFGPKPRPLEV